MAQSVADKKALKEYLEKLKRIRDIGGVDSEESDASKKKRIDRAQRDYKYCFEYYFPHYALSECADFQIYFANAVRKNTLFKGGAEWGRGLAKSVHVNMGIPFWLWIRGEPMYLVLVGNNKDRAEQLLEDLQAEFEANPRIIHDFGEQHNSGSWDQSLWVTKGGFIGQALGMGQSVRGLRVKAQRPTYCAMDDCETKEINKNPKRQEEIAQWVERDLIPTMIGDFRRFIQANNRFAKRMIQTILQERHPKWFYHRVNAFDPVTYEPSWPQRNDAEYYRQLEEELGTIAVGAEYNNKPHSEGKIFKDEMLQYCKIPARNHFTFIAGHWDVAYAGTPTSDYNAVTIVGVKDKEYFLIDSFCKQSKMKAALEYMAEYQKSLPDTVEVHFRYESQFWNDELQRTIEEVEEEQGISLNLVKWDRSGRNKYDRILSMHPVFQNNRFWISEKLKSHNDTNQGLDQLKGIEPGYSGHDDWPDALEATLKECSAYVRTGKHRDPVFQKNVSKNADY